MPMPHHLRTSVVGTLLAGSLVLLSGAPASARIVETFPLDDSFAEELTDFCGVDGLTVDFTFSQTGSGTLSERGRDGLLFFTGHTRSVETFSFGGRTVTGIGNHLLEKDLKVVPNGDGTLSITILLTGPFRHVNHEGKVIAKNDGQVRVLLIFDPVTETELSREVIFGSTGTNDDVCAAVLADFGF